MDSGWVSSPKRAVCVFLGEIDAIDAIDAIEAIEGGLLGLCAWWDGGDKKVGRRGCEG